MNLIYRKQCVLKLGALMYFLDFSKLLLASFTNIFYFSDICDGTMDLQFIMYADVASSR